MLHTLLITVWKWCYPIKIYTKTRITTLTFIKTSNKLRHCFVKLLEFLDAYIKVTLMAAGAKMKKRRTSTKLNDPNPVFNETFNFQLSEEERRQARFLISVQNVRYSAISTTLVYIRWKVKQIINFFQTSQCNDFDCFKKDVSL